VKGFLLRLLITAAGLWVASAIVPSMEFASGWTLLGAALLLGIVNAVVRPIFVFLTLPITILSLGVFLLIINAAMLAIVAGFLPGFTLGGFFAAFFGAIFVSLTSGFASWFIGPKGRVEIMCARSRD
jgi:putative membrane protein